MKGRFGPYLKYGDRNISLPKKSDPLSISLEECAAVIADDGRKKSGPVAEWGDIQVLRGKYGPYIKYAGSNYKIPAGTDAETLTEEQCRTIISEGAPTKKRSFPRKSSR